MAPRCRAHRDALTDPCPQASLAALRRLQLSPAVITSQHAPVINRHTRRNLTRSSKSLRGKDNLPSFTVQADRYAGVPAIRRGGFDGPAAKPPTPSSSEGSNRRRWRALLPVPSCRTFPVLLREPLAGTTVHTIPGTLGHLPAWFSQVKCMNRPGMLGAILTAFRLTSEGSLVRTQLCPPGKMPVDCKSREGSLRCLRFSAAQDRPVLSSVQVVPPWTEPALRRNMAAIWKHGQARSGQTKCPRFQGNPEQRAALWIGYYGGTQKMSELCRFRIGLFLICS